MGDVLWANRLIDGAVESDESDKYALNKHLPKLDKLAKECGLPAFSSMCDTTDLRFNAEDDLELPDGMTSTNEWMAVEGVWIDSDDAVHRLQTMIVKIESEKIKFGLLRNDYDAVVAELKESLEFARGAAVRGGKFNFSVVM
jgi:hypothetical protein